jgi:hypothetical protein
MGYLPGGFVQDILDVLAVAPQPRMSVPAVISRITPLTGSKHTQTGKTAARAPHTRENKMIDTISHSTRRLSVVAAAAAAALLIGCADQEPLTPEAEPVTQAQFAGNPAKGVDRAVALLRRVTARYHDLDAAIADGFVLLHPCEERPGEGPVGIVYVHFNRLLDGIIDPETPDALIYEPAENGQPKLVGVEFAIPYALWPSPQPPTYHGATFQPEDEFGVFALHVWVWRHNPEGLFAESNPTVTCDAN